MGRMKNWLTEGVVLVAVVCAAAAMLSQFGCSGTWPIKWQPSEQQKQAADLTVTDLLALAPHTEPPGEPIRLEALVAAKATQTYMGLPADRPEPVAPGNLEIIDQAIADAEQAPPTPAETVGAVLDKTKEAVNVGFTLAQLLLTGAGSVAGIWGLGNGVKWIRNMQAGAVEAQAKVGTSLQAVTELVAGIDALDAATKKAVLDKQNQSHTTEAIVRGIRKPLPAPIAIPRPVNTGPP